MGKITIILIITLILLAGIPFYLSYSFTHPDFEMSAQAVVKQDRLQNIPIIQKSIDENEEQIINHTEQISFLSRDGITLKGQLLKNTENKGTIILAHGWNARKESMTKYALFLNDDGYNILLLDFRSYGESSGDYTSFGYAERYDIMGAVDYIIARNDLSSNIGGLGASMGAAALVFAAVETDQLKFLILDSCYTSIYDTLKNRFEYFHLPKHSPAAILTLSIGVMTGFNSFESSPAEAIKEVKAPAFIIQGNADYRVTVEDAYKLHNSAQNPRGILIIDGAKHIGSYKAEPNIYKAKVLEFVENANSAE
ncbi:MAG TPA: alpha/beta hydrolase [Candidatus Nanoarchaeia archaeon]|nr:alpha/beta hydrolase [Candidatus Nanoarchaeia archaeon]